MRIARLDLTRYGHFTGKPLALPRSEQDLHVLVGPNEAGKSTLRNAVLDLLFGIETRSRYNFRHAYSEMRLGALLEQDGEVLDFQRVKGRVRTLRDPEDGVLPDAALVPFTGDRERGFFEQMFGLDHDRLVQGGQDILDAGSDLGQILFQASAGIEGFGNLRDALEAEADKLWARRKSSDREYYIAAAELDEAKAALKASTVHTKVWTEAHQAVEQLRQEADALHARAEELAQRRSRLERARRTAPVLQRLREQEAAMNALGRVRLLPEEAANRLQEAERMDALAASARRLLEKQAMDKTEARDAIRIDAALLSREQDIQALAAGREQVRHHAADVDKRREEARAHWKTLEGLTRRLGWSVSDEQTLAASLPSGVLRDNAAALIRDHDKCAQTLRSAREARDAKAQELRRIEQRLSGLPAAELPDGLAAALAEARALGDANAQEKRLAEAATRAERALARAIDGLGPWRKDPRQLRGLQPPTSAELDSLRQTLDRLTGEAERQRQDIREHEARIAELALAVQQYQAAHQPVSLQELLAARQARDGLWQQIRAGAQTLEHAADPYEHLLGESDRLADRRHDTAEEAAALQSKQQELERLRLRLGAARDHADGVDKALADAQSHWAARMQALGLSDMTLEQMGSWCTAREQVLSADEHLADARAELEGLRRRVADAGAKLSKALPSAAPSGADLNAIVRQAADLTEQASRVRTWGDSLREERDNAAALLATLEDALNQAAERLARWQEDWRNCLGALNLPAETGIEAAEQALATLSDMDQHLAKRQELMNARIRPMERDLQRFADAALALAADLDPGLSDGPPADIARVLNERLAQAQRDARDRERLSGEIDAARREAEREARAQAQAKAELQPLLAQAGADDNDALREAIRRSDNARTLAHDIEQLKTNLAQAADGIPRDRLEAELAELDSGAIPGQLEILQQDLSALMAQQRENAAASTKAQAELDRIAGQDDAARAEARRQEALARMGNAVERYLRTYTAARLLRWAIERYREQRQGPMLARAGEIFADLTLGSFERLVVDYEGEAPTLHGRRPDGERVGIDGLSDGSRDQLYLALRLAAMELHLQQASPMPFIADDLFINWDDRRAAAGLAALAHLSRRTQVLFLTHHEHLAALAGDVLPGGVNVVRLAA